MQSLELPWPNWAVLANNGRRRLHWSKIAPVERDHKRYAWAALHQQKPPRTAPEGKLFIEWVCHPPKGAHVKRDEDNASGAFKAYQDVIADWIGVDDKVFQAPRIVWGDRRKPATVFARWGAVEDYTPPNPLQGTPPAFGVSFDTWSRTIHIKSDGLTPAEIKALSDLVNMISNREGAG